MRLGDYDNLLAFASLRGGGEYVTTYVNSESEMKEELVCAIVLAGYGPTAGGISEDTLLIELGADGQVLADTLYLEPSEAMESWPNVTWQPLAGVDDVEDFVRNNL